ncbi:response regulator [Desulfocurvibacter africanus]|uniref:Response regulator receiver protein n=1 Tax=Desulfocurvibacter africanus subsp. africanus str. Walvis Bay TaxID=690850 RepID=F3Z3M0_DESAF|nr:response regulator [Desulfocurvibacter africanus]EGJ50392.1 response regulator receiver protein [Desulfocurvibacter africanus subsp. africanus str. Walvis Bay]
MAEKVLLVDDEQNFLEALFERMRLRGMEVSVATSGEEALGKVENDTYDAIVLDLMLPGMDGFEALKIIKARRPETQVILLTGRATVEMSVEAMKLGAMDFMEKPADIGQLIVKIKKAQVRKMILVERKSEE